MNAILKLIESDTFNFRGLSVTFPDPYILVSGCHRVPCCLCKVSEIKLHILGNVILLSDAPWASLRNIRIPMILKLGVMKDCVGRVR